MRRAAAAALAAASALVASAAWGARGEAPPPNPSARADCRYLSTEDRSAARSEGSYRFSAFPPDDVFRPPLADPKQPQFFAEYERLRARATGETLDVGSVGFGESFGLLGYRTPTGCDGFQVGLHGGVFAQFNLGAPSSDLINADYVVGFPVTFRRGLWSARLRIYHQSSHLGDEFLLGNPGIRRVNLSFEEVDGLVSFEWRWARLYGGGGYLVNKEPSTLRPAKVQWGAEVRGPRFRAPFAGAMDEALGDVRITPVLSADFKVFEQLAWGLNTSLAGGIEWSGERSQRRLRLLVTWYRGHTPYGQFFDQKVESFGIGAFFSF